MELEPRRIFGIDEANRLVPLLRGTFDQVRPVALQLRDLLDSGVSSAADRAHLVKRIEDLLAPLIELGIEVKAVDGLVDFCARRDGRVVYLCWRYPETEIRWWHEVDSGFAGRQRIKARREFGDSYLC